METHPPTPVQIALDRAIAIVKGKNELMNRLNDKGHKITSYNTINQWRRCGTPAKYCPDIETITGVACEDLCPGTNWAVLRNANPELAIAPVAGA